MAGRIHSALLGVKLRLSEMPRLAPHKHPRVTLWVSTLLMAVLYLEAGYARSAEDSDLVLAR